MISRIMKTAPLQAVMGALLPLMVVSSVSAGEEYAGRAVARPDSLPVHSRASENSKVVTSLPKGTEVTVDFEMQMADGPWCGIMEKGRESISGYVKCGGLERRSHSRKWKLIGSTAVDGPAGPQQEAKKAAPILEKNKRPFSTVMVRLYMTSWCPYCRKAREYLKSLGVNLVEYDIEADRGKREEMIAKGGLSGVPFIDVEGIYVRGFSEGEISRSVEQRRSL